MKDLDEWWQSLSVNQKIRIASKVLEQDITYPKCSEVWNNLSIDKKKKIHEHCTDKHGYLLQEWSEGNMYSE